MANFDESKFQKLKSTVLDTSPYCGGILTIPIDEFTLFYGKDANLGYGASHHWMNVCT